MNILETKKLLNYDELPKKTNKKLDLVIDLDICVGCHACAGNCKEWNTSSLFLLHDVEPYGDDPTGVV